MMIPDLFRSTLKPITIALLGLFITNASLAVDRYWTGEAGDFLWGTSTNWSPNGLPSSSDLVFFNTEISDGITIGGDRSILGFRFSGGYTHTITGSGAIALHSGGVEISAENTVNFNAWVRPTTATTLIQNDGNLIFGSNVPYQTTVQNTTTFTGTGSTTVTRLSRRRPTYDLNVIKAGTGQLIITNSENAKSKPDDGAIQGGQGYIAGNLTINEGTVFVRNTTGSATGAANVTVNANGKLGGTGSVIGDTGKSIIVNTGGTLFVGNTHGTGGSAQALQLGAYSPFILEDISSNAVSVQLHGNLQFDITGAGSLNAMGSESYDSVTQNDLLRIATSGSLDLSNAIISIAAQNATGWGEGQTWKLMDWSQLTVSSLTYEGLTLDTTQLFGWYLIPTIIQSGSGAGFYLTASAVPEPSRLGLLALALLPFLLLRKR